jgi:hypothetical protein
MNMYFIYRPSTHEFLRFYDGGPYGPHVGWTYDSGLSYLFHTRKQATTAAEAISQADHLQIQVITFREMGRSTIEWHDAS